MEGIVDIASCGTRGKRGRPRRRFMDVVEEDMQGFVGREEDARNIG